MSKFSIKEVTEAKDLEKFINFPHKLYKSCPQYVPALYETEFHTLSKSASLLTCTRKMWIVQDSTKIVGRICAIINPRYNEIYKLKRVRFGWFDCINNLEVAELLISTAQNWAAEQGMDEIHGPLGYNVLGTQGLVVEGYEHIPPFNCPYNYPYYNDLLLSLGFTKECDWIQYRIVANHGVPDKARRMAQMCQEKYNLKPASIDQLKNDPKMVRKFVEAYNRSFSNEVYNFVPLTEAEIEEMARLTLPYISDKTSCILVDENNEIAAFGISIPSVSIALQKAKGKLFPFGWLHLAKARRDYEFTDLMINGATPEWRNTGISSLYYREMADRAIKVGNRWAYTNPQIESDSAINIWNSYEREAFMRRRSYIKKINTDGRK